MNEIVKNNKINIDFLENQNEKRKKILKKKKNVLEFIIKNKKSDKELFSDTNNETFTFYYEKYIEYVKLFQEFDDNFFRNKKLIELYRKYLQQSGFFGKLKKYDSLEQFQKEYLYYIAIKNNAPFVTFYKLCYQNKIDYISKSIDVCSDIINRIEIPLININHKIKRWELFCDLEFLIIQKCQNIMGKQYYTKEQAIKFADVRIKQLNEIIELLQKKQKLLQEHIDNNTEYYDLLSDSQKAELIEKELEIVDIETEIEAKKNFIDEFENRK